MSKLITRASVNGTTLAGANLKAALLGIVDALNSAGLQEGSRATISTSGTLSTTQCGLLLVDCTAGNVLLTLPTSGAATDDASYIIRRIDSSANTLTIQRGGTDNVEGAAIAKTIAANGIMVLQLPAGGTNWRVLNISGATPFDALANLGINTLATTGASPTYAVATPVQYGLVAKSRLRLQFNAANAGVAATLAINGGTAKSLKQYDSTGAKVDPTIAASQISDVEYDGTDQVILDPFTPAASTTASGVVQLATVAQAIAGTDTTRAVTAAGVAAAIAANAFGVGQTWTDVTTTPGRTSGTVYTNTTGKPIEVNCLINTSGGGSYTVGGLTQTLSTSNTQVPISFTVPNGISYSITSSISKWLELR